MKIGYIVKNDLELNPHLTQRFEFKEATFTRAIKKKISLSSNRCLYFKFKNGERWYDLS